MPEHPINDPKHWLNRAKEARALAEQIDDPEAKRTMLKNADDYERLAQRAQERAAGRLPQSKYLFDQVSVREFGRGLLALGGPHGSIPRPKWRLWSAVPCASIS
jgi:hypothetical protein